MGIRDWKAEDFAEILAQVEERIREGIPETAIREAETGEMGEDRARWMEAIRRDARLWVMMRATGEIREADTWDAQIRRAQRMGRDAGQADRQAEAGTGEQGQGRQQRTETEDE